MKRLVTTVSLAAAALMSASAPSAAWAATVSLEIASQGRGQTTAPQEWLQQLNRAGVTTVRIRGARVGDTPTIETIEGARGAVHRLTGVLTARGELVLPGGRFSRRDATGLRDYFDRLKADGAEAVTEPTGNFGLTKKQFELAFEALSKPLAIKTAGRAPRAVLDRVGARLAMPLVVSPGAAAKLQAAPAIRDELGTLTIGSGLAIALRAEGLAIAPHKPRGGPLELRVAPASEDEAWPIGYPVKGAPRNTAPDLMQSINVEIDGFTLAEAIGAITPRLELPVLWDTATLTRLKIDPASINVKLPRSRASYKRILERLLFQARLRGKLHTDEAGTPFYWITR
ncbi:MAG: hypothetical protein AAGB00_03410 [Planctomycetota bacterium]